MQYFTLVFLVIALASCSEKASTNEDKPNSGVAVPTATEPAGKTSVPNPTQESPAVADDGSPLPLDVDISKTDNIVQGYTFTENTSPNGLVNLIIREIDPSASSAILETEAGQIAFEGMYVSPQSHSWSENSQFVALANADLYAGAGAVDLTILSSVSKSYIQIDYAELTSSLDLQGRTRLDVENLSWTGLNSLNFTLVANYLGSSGHPGIDSERQRELGDNFEKNDPVIVGHYTVRINE